MKALFDVVSAGYAFPLSRKQAIAAVRFACADIPGSLERIAEVRFGANQSTTQEGQISERGERYFIRINFALNGSTTRQLSDVPAWCGPIEACGGRIDVENSRVEWTRPAAAAYAAFLLFHELAHLAYSEKHGLRGFELPKAGSEEERYCDQWALEMLGRWRSGVA